MGLYVLLGMAVLELAVIAALLWRPWPDKRRPSFRYSRVWRRQMGQESDAEREKRLEESWNRGVESLLGYDISVARKAERQERQ